MSLPDISDSADLGHANLATHIADHLEQLADAFLCAETSADFARTFLANVGPLQQLVVALAAANPRVVTDGATTATGTTVTSASAQFGPYDVGRPIAGGSLPAGTTVAEVTDAQTVTVSQAATADGTGLNLTIG